jgi:hypothetical protein
MMTLEDRADLIADASPYVPDTIVWKSLRERALQQLREAAAESWRVGYSQGITTQRGETA